MKRLSDALDALGLQGAADALLPAAVTIVASSSFPNVLPRLARTVGPAYLPILGWQGSHFCLHVRPGRALEASPVVFCDHEELGARFVAGSLRDLPRGLWLWLVGFNSLQEDQHARFLAGLDSLAGILVGGRPIPPEFRAFKDGQQGRWFHDEEADPLWLIADVGLPVAGLPLKDGYDPGPNVAAMRPFVEARENDAVELLALRVAMDRFEDLPVDVPACLRVLAAESWRESDYGLFLPGLPGGDGLPAWDRTLAYSLEGHRDQLRGTAFAPLEKVPTAYSGREGRGPALLREVAKAFRAAGDTEAVLNQLRNAAQLSVLLRQGVSRELFAELRDACDAIEPGGLATELTLAYADAQQRAP